MKIGIDVGGSHIGLGIIDKQGKIILKKEKDYIVKNIDMSNIVIDTIKELIKETLEKLDIKKQAIEKIGIAFPRDSIQWGCSESGQFRY